MNLLRDAPFTIQLLLALLLAGAAIQDVARRKIPNWFCLAVAALAIVAAIIVGPTLALWQNAVIFAALLAVGVPLFAAGWLGGGDVKLLAALGLWANFAAIFPLLAGILITGGVLAAVSLFVRRKPAAGRSRGVPYGVAIAVGAAIVMLPPTLTGAGSKHLDPLDLKAANKRLTAT